MDVPQKIKDRIAAMIEDDKKQKEIIERTRPAEAKRLKKINNLRQRRYTKVYMAAGFVMRWLCEFWKSEAAKEIFRLQKEVVLFRAHFWRGEPAPETDITTWATLNMCRPVKDYKEATLEYRELHKAHVSHSEEISRSFADYNGEPWKTIYLVDGLHPEFLLQFAEAIKTGKVWDYIERSLR